MLLEITSCMYNNQKVIELSDPFKPKLKLETVPVQEEDINDDLLLDSDIQEEYTTKVDIKKFD